MVTPEIRGMTPEEQEQFHRRPIVTLVPEELRLEFGYNTVTPTEQEKS